MIMNAYICLISYTHKMKAKINITRITIGHHRDHIYKKKNEPLSWGLYRSGCIQKVISSNILVHFQLETCQEQFYKFLCPLHFKGM